MSAVTRCWLCRGIRVALLGLWLIQTCPGQSYPRWFLDQEEVPCVSATVGYASPSFYPDSSAAQAFRDGCETFARQSRLDVSGGQAFWSTEIGVYWMGSDFREQYDTSEVARARSVLRPLDTFRSSGLVAVLLGDPGCEVDELQRTAIPIRGTQPPSWTQSPPQGTSDYYAVGIAPEYFYEVSCWRLVERRA